MALVFLWFTSSLLLSIGLAGNDIPVQIIGAVLGTAYVLVLIWWLTRNKPQSIDLPDIQPKSRLFSNYRVMLGLVIITSLLIVALTCFLLQVGG